MYTGPEMAYAFVTDLTEPVTVTLTGLEDDLDLYALDSTVCNGESCITASDSGDTDDESLTFDATSGEEVIIVLDGYEGSVSSYTLEFSCDGGLPEVPEDAGVEDGGPDSDSDVDSDSDSDTDSDTDPATADSNMDPGGCGCAVAVGEQNRPLFTLFTLAF